MTNQSNRFALAVSALVLVVLAGCSSDSDPSSESPPSVSPSSSAEAEASPSASLTQSERAAQHATSVVHDYFEVVDRLRKDSGVKLTELKRVTTSSQLVSQRRLIEGERATGLRQTGATRIAELEVQSVNLDNSDPDVGRVPTVAIDVCWDVSQADLVNERGRSVITGSRPPTGWTRYVVANYQWSKNPSGGWRIAASESLEKSSCAAA